MDITAGMNNSSMISSKCLDEQNHTPTNISHVPKAHSTPSHFMTPTFASRRSEIGKSNNRIAAHVSIKSIKADGGHSLLNSVAKRVGLRVGDGGTQKKKEGPAKHSKVISFPDKVQELLTRKSKLANSSTAFCTLRLDGSRLSRDALRERQGRTKHIPT